MGKLIVNSHNHKDALTIMFTYSKDAMNATETIQKTYTLEEFKEIANHGCQSGVCTQHIYYGHTVSFYDTFEEDIVDTLESEFGTEFLIDLFKQADACIDIYKNHMCWAFIEHVAFVTVDEDDERMELEEAKIAEYMTANVY